MTDSNDSAAAKSSTKDKWVKRAFVFVAVAGVIGIWWYNRNPAPPVGDWSSDLTASLTKAKADGRKVLLYFASNPASEDDRRMNDVTLNKPENKAALKDGNFVLVKTTLDTALKSEQATRYKIRKLPTMLLLDSNGKELNRREGYIGEVDFRSGFLDAKKVQQP